MHAAGERRGVIHFDDEVEVVALDGEVDEAEAEAIAAALEGPCDA